MKATTSPRPEQANAVSDWEDEGGARGPASMDEVNITGGDMSGKNTAVFGIFPTRASADAAVDALRTKGFRNTDVSVLFPQNVGSTGETKGDFGNTDRPTSVERLATAEVVKH